MQNESANPNVECSIMWMVPQYVQYIDTYIAAKGCSTEATKNQLL